MPLNESISPELIGERIKSARLNSGIKQEDLAELVGLSRPAISLIEAGKRSIDSMELVSLAQALHKPISFFLESSVIDKEEQPLEVLFRAEEVNEVDKAVIEDFAGLCRDYSSLEMIVGISNKSLLPSWTSSISTKGHAIDDGNKVALSVRKQLSLGTAPIADIGAVMELLGIKVVYRDIHGSKVWGFSVTSKTFGSAVFVNTACTRARQRFTLAHELGHLIMDHHHRATIFSESRTPAGTFDGDRAALVETRANTFAAALLMPDKGIEEGLSQFSDPNKSKVEITPHMLSYLAKYFGVSYESLLWRMVNLKFISKQEREQFAKLQILLEPEANLSQPDEGRERITLPEKYKALAFEAYKQAKISISKFAEFLRIDLYQARTLVKEYVIRQPRVRIN
ncbi:MAG: ImmA/IrrE family metallo-endopeptidase [Nitrososphaerota archaeon]|nr:ImmA/IrrE family metallo-endopeptidase [Nitrososphaerota archaeon]